ncbi:MAG: alpha-L-fucosidase [Lentisphaerae bacterium]|nr:alpha-L-fucosidase [Lentisphaerota bacterium]
MSENEVVRWDYRTPFRYLVDMHVPDWDPRMMAAFEADAHVRLVKRTGAQSLMIYAKSHAGQCFWNTRLGGRHRVMGARDFFGDTVAACRRHGLIPRGYFSVIFDSWAYEQHPDWRQVPATGEASVLKQRYGVVCPNAPGYRDYVAACLQEILAYDIPDIFFDMMFWPWFAPCCCGHCVERFRREQGRELPRVPDWEDDAWRALQRSRQAWMLEFARFIYQTVKARRSDVTVSHNQAPFLLGWEFGVPFELVEACDYAFGDFYGGPTQHALACKLYQALKPESPFEFATFVKRNPQDHVTVKCDDELRIDAAIPMLHGGAMLQIDAVNVDGTLNPAVYERLDAVNRFRAPFAASMGGQLLADVGLYLDRESMHPGGGVKGDLHVEAATGAARVLQEAHIPFGVVTNVTLDRLAHFQAVVLPGVLEMTDAQAAVVRRYVEGGGRIYASGPTALDRFGRGATRYLPEDVFGVRFAGYAGEDATFLTPVGAGDVMAAMAPQDHVLYRGACCRAEALPGTAVLARVTLPFVPPSAGRTIGQTFASIHSNPPALAPEAWPALTVHPFGKGLCVWSAMSFEKEADPAARALLTWVIRRLLSSPCWFEAEAPASVEITLRHDTDRNRLLLGLLHLQKPAGPVAARVQVRLPEGARLAKVVDLAHGALVMHRTTPGMVSVDVAPFDHVVMLALELETA